MKIIAYKWHTGRANIGIVLYQNDHKVMKAVMTTVDGFDEDDDLAKVMDYGSKISTDMMIGSMSDGQGTIMDIDLWNEYKKRDARTVLDADDFKALVSGKILEKPEGKIILSDIGWDLMIELINNAKDE